MISALEGLSITEYVRILIEKDLKENQDKAIDFLKEN